MHQMCYIIFSPFNDNRSISVAYNLSYVKNMPEKLEKFFIRSAYFHNRKQLLNPLNTKELYSACVKNTME
jgi:hypothetical protein